MVDPTENRISPLRALIVADRLAGMRNRDIAAKHGIKRFTVGDQIRRAIRNGDVKPEQLNLRKPTWTLPAKEIYDKEWIARIRAQCASNGKGCWHWTGNVNYKGYGQAGYRGRNVLVHRHMYKLTRGVELATTQFVCHTCDDRRCCNPEHLWLGTTTDNIRDMIEKGRNFFLKKTHCKRGHPFTPENTYIKKTDTRSGIARVCMTCFKMRLQSPKYVERRRERQRRQREKKRAQVVHV